MARQFDKSVLTVQEEQRLIKEMSDYYMQHEYDPNNEQMKQELENYLYRLFELNVNEMGYIPELTENNGGKVDFENANKIRLQFFEDIDDLGVGYTGISGAQEIDENGNAIFGAIPISINMARAQKGEPFDIVKLISGMYHELNHVRQLIMVREGISSKETIQYAREFALKQAGKSGFYIQNYNKLFTESESLRDVDLTEIGTKSIFGGIKNVGYYSLNKNYINPIFRDEVSDELDTCITSDLIKLYPVLQKEYNMDGTRKSATQLVTSLKAELDNLSSNDELDEYDKRNSIKDCKEMYFELIFRAIDKEGLTVEQISQLDSMYAEYGSLSTDIQSYFESQIKKISEAEHSLTPQEIEDITNFYKDKINALTDREWSFGLTEEEQQKAAEERKALEKSENDYNNPNGKPITFKRKIHKQTIKFVDNSELGDTSEEWSFGLTEEEQQKAAEERKALEKSGNDYNNPNGKPRQYESTKKQPIRITLSDVEDILDSSDITLSEYKEGVTKLKEKVIEQTRGNNEVTEQQRNDEHARERE